METAILETNNVVTNPSQPPVAEEPIPESQPQVRVICSDYQQFVIPRELAKMFGYMRPMLEEDSDVDNDDISDFPVPNVTGGEMCRIVEFCNHYLKDPFPKIKVPVKSNNIADHVPTWYAEFVKPIGEDESYKLIMAANFLDCQPMFELISATIACNIFDKTPNEVREMFNIPEDISHEKIDEERKMRTWREEHPGYPESDPTIIEFEASKKLTAVAAGGENA